MSYFFPQALRHHMAAHREAVCVFALAVASLITRFIFIGHPNSAVFDEVHFNYFASFYYSGQYFFDIHPPPLGKLLIALSAMPFGGIQAEDVVRTISTPYPNGHYVAMRSLAAVLGACIPLLLFAIARELSLSLKAALLAGSLAALDNALLVQSRLILLDAMLLFFGLSSFWMFLRARRTNKILLLGGSALLAGCSLSVKWIGVSFLGLIGLIMLVDWCRASRTCGWTPTPLYKGVAYLGVVTGVYLLVFAIHFALLPISHKQGDQFMSVAFQSTLEGNRYYRASGTISSIACPQNYRHDLTTGTPNTEVSAAQSLACQIRYSEISPPGFWRKLLELNRLMYTTNQGLTKGHPDASPWYSWPYMQKPLYYWHRNGARVYLLGNPSVWWITALAVIALILGQMPYSHWRRGEAFWVLMTGYWASLLPFMLVNRVMFMYHYLTSLCFAILLSAYLSDLIKRPKWLTAAVCALAAFAFLLISPLTYGFNWYGSDLLWLLRAFGWHP